MVRFHIQPYGDDFYQITDGVKTLHSDGERRQGITGRDGSCTGLFIRHEQAKQILNKFIRMTVADINVNESFSFESSDKIYRMLSADGYPGELTHFYVECNGKINMIAKGLQQRIFLAD